MTSFRRLVIGIAEAVAVVSIFVCTLIAGLVGAASGAFRSGTFAALSNAEVNLQSLGAPVSTGTVVGFFVGAVGGFVVSSTLAGILFIFAQIERNTRSLLYQESFRGSDPRAAPRS